MFYKILFQDYFKIMINLLPFFYRNVTLFFSWQDLKDFMRKAGEVTYGDAHGDCGKNRGLVCFVTKSDMERAVDELDGREINGREVRYVF